MSGTNEALREAAAAAGLAADPALRFAFGLACVQRVAHLLEHPRAIAAVPVLVAFVAGQAPPEALAAARDELQAVATGHRGSASMDGSGHAAVSATYALANALAGRALQAADYAAYAAVYAYGGYALSDPSAFEPEFAWQVDELHRLAAARARAAG